MKCDTPGCEHEATVHEVTIKAGKKVEKHLCEQCAREHGISVQTHAPISELLTKFVMSQSGGGEEEQEGAQPATRATTCASCGMTWARFRQHGVLGCADCYGVFEEQLSPLIERAHQGATHHVGKTPQRAGEGLALQNRMAALRRELQEAVASEQYERAARLRDELRTCLGEGCGGDAPKRAGNGNGGATRHGGEA